MDTKCKDCAFRGTNKTGKQGLCVVLGKYVQRKRETCEKFKKR